ncbi:MAG: hypothetical protein VX712_12780 [Bacteroidota bacterium]|uniref:hypothetical protein n=1 Tax=Christiangramia TaxID=292691 RepID=UPI0009F81B30|nr:hypothetical protein [Christiangramia flava]MAM19536.1 hypothetical protein [Christiangramia sp.]MEE2773081.1 hypothetical protein [Bacteroidota bacterium]
MKSIFRILIIALIGVSIAILIEMLLLYSQNKAVGFTISDLGEYSIVFFITSFLVYFQHRKRKKRKPQN